MRIVFITRRCLRQFRTARLSFDSQLQSRKRIFFFSRIFPGDDRFAFDVAIHVLVAKVLVTKWHLAEAATFSPEDEISSEVHWSKGSIFWVLFSSKMTIYLFNIISTISIP